MVITTYITIMTFQWWHY